MRIPSVKSYDNKQTNFKAGQTKFISLEVDLLDNAPIFRAIEAAPPTKEEIIEGLKQLYIQRAHIIKNKHRKVNMHAFFPIRTDGKMV